MEVRAEYISCIGKIVQASAQVPLDTSMYQGVPARQNELREISMSLMCIASEFEPMAVQGTRRYAVARRVGTYHKLVPEVA